MAYPPLNQVQSWPSPDIFDGAPLQPAAIDWSNRVATNGGGAVSMATLKAVSQWYAAINGAGTILAKIKSCILITPGSIIEAVTPIVKTFGTDPWGHTGSLELTVNGLRSMALNNYVSSGCIPSACFASTSTGGLTAYVVATTTSDSAAVDIGCTSDASHYCALYSNFYINPNQYAVGDMYNNTNNFFSNASPGKGFFSANVVGGTGQMYFGNAGGGLVALGASRPGAAGTLPTFQIYAMGLNSSGAIAGTTTVRRYSHFCIHDGFTLAEETVYFNATQALRVKLGGGYV